MTRLFGLIVLAVLLWICLEVAVRFLQNLVGGVRTVSGRMPPPPGVSREPGGPRAIQELVRCSRCGVYVPRPRTVALGGEAVCEACRQTGDRARAS
jgi:hypothetical protein